MMNANSSAIESTGSFAPFRARRFVANRINVLKRATRERVVPVRDDDQFYEYRRNELAAVLKSRYPDSSGEQRLEVRDDDRNQPIRQRESSVAWHAARGPFGRLGLEDMA